MALSFGVTVLPDPPYSRFLELIVLAEAHGFEYGWTYDSHVLWQESFPLLTMAAQATSHDEVRPLRDEPGHARADGARERLRDAARHLRRPHGDGHRPRRLGAPLHRPASRCKVAEFERRCRMIKDFMNGREVDWNDKELQLKWVRPELPEIPMWVAGYGPKALAVAGRVGDGVIIQLADPVIIQWIMDTARKAAEEAGRDPSELKCIVCAPSHISDDIADAREQVRWFPAMVSNHVMDLIERYGFESEIPHELTEYVRGAQVLRLQRALARRREARRVRHRRDLRPLLRARERRAGDREAEGARVGRRRPVQHLPHDPRPGGGPRRVRQGHHSGSSAR